MTKGVAPSRLSRLFGTLFLWSAGVLAVLIFVDKWTEVKFPFPSFWYTTRSFHFPGCIVLLAVGWLSHRNASASQQGEDATASVFRSVTVYGKPDCSLCDRAMELLSEYSDVLPKLSKVDITGNEELEAQHAESVPVVEIDGRVRFRGIVSAELLERLIDARQRQRNAGDLQ